MFELAIRLVFSLAVVIGMVMLLAKLSSKRFRGSADALVRVVHRQPLTRNSSVAVVTIGSRVLVLGTTEQQVQLLTELDPEELDVDLAIEDTTSGQDTGPVDGTVEDVVRELQPAARRTRRASSRAHARTTTDSALAGSVLSAQTWKQAFAAATRKPQDAS